MCYVIGEVSTDDRSLCIGFGPVSWVYSCALVLTCVLCTQSNRLMGTVSLSAHYLRFLSTIKEKLALKLNFY